jgi:light-regulated signal transduction histidine kinase (bacteriophytochrome)
VSHDLRAPLRHLSAYTSELAAEHADALDADGRAVLGRIAERCGNMNALIEGLLQLSRVSRGPVKRKDLDLSAMAGELADELRRSEPERPVAVSIQPGLRAQGDPVLVRTLLQNLLGNAWKYSSKVPVARIGVAGARIGDEEVYRISDNGAGFEPRYADRLFGAFQRLHTSKEFEGTGIGLATAKRIVERHGGRVWAESAPGEGATFYFTLPDEKR